MNECTGPLTLPSTACDTRTVTERIYQAANLLQVRPNLGPGDQPGLQVPGGQPDQLQFAGQTVSGAVVVLVTVDLAGGVSVNTERIVLGGMLVRELRAALERE